MRALNIVFGLMGLAGGFFTAAVAAPAICPLGGPALAAGVLACGLVAEFVGVQTLMTGLLGSDDDQFRL